MAPFDIADFPLPIQKEQERTLEGFVAWLESQPRDREYCWANTGKCLYHHWGVALGFEPNVAYDKALEIARKIMPGRYGMPSVLLPHTFGAAAKRAKALLSRRRKPDRA